MKSDTRKKYRAIDLFSGAGGMSLGFAGANFADSFDCVLAVDNDRASLETHHHNLGGEIVLTNIEDWLATNPTIPLADVVIGGPPCQGFSLLNKNRDGDSRRALWEPYMDVVRDSGARLFVMENVAELFKSEELNEIKRRAKALGFKTKAAVLNAADYGAPQVRKRTIVIGWLVGKAPEPQFPPPQTHAA